MTKENAAEYLPLIEALRDGELQVNQEGGWVDCVDTNLRLPASYYRRRPKPREWWIPETVLKSNCYYHQATGTVHVQEVL